MKKRLTGLRMRSSTTDASCFSTPTNSCAVSSGRRLLASDRGLTMTCSLFWGQWRFNVRSRYRHTMFEVRFDGDLEAVGSRMPSHQVNRWKLLAQHSGDVCEGALWRRQNLKSPPSGIHPKRPQTMFGLSLRTSSVRFCCIWSVGSIPCACESHFFSCDAPSQEMFSLSRRVPLRMIRQFCFSRGALTRLSKPCGTRATPRRCTTLSVRGCTMCHVTSCFDGTDFPETAARKERGLDTVHLACTSIIKNTESNLKLIVSFVRCLTGLLRVRTWRRSMVLVLMCEPASLVAPGALVLFDFVPAVGAWTLDLEIDWKHKSAALPVVLGGVGLHSTEPHPWVFRAVPDIPPWMRDAPKRGRLDDGAACGRPVPGPARRGGAASHWSSSIGVDGSRNLPDSFPSLDNAASRSRLSLLISKAISCFSRYPRRWPAGSSVFANGPLDIDQVWLRWERHQGISRQQLLQCITAHAFGSEGRRRFLLHSDDDGDDVAESLRGLPRRHRLRRASRTTPGSAEVAVISSDSSLPAPPGDVSADPEPPANASLPDSSLSDPVKTENDGTLPDTMEAAAGVDISPCLPCED